VHIPVSTSVGGLLSKAVDLFHNKRRYLYMQLKPDINKEDLNIVQGLIDGSREAYAGFSERFSGFIYRECLIHTGDVEESKDLLNEILIKLLITIEKFDAEKGALSTWVMSITGNFLIDYFRKKETGPDIIYCDSGYFDLFPSKRADMADEKTETERDPVCERMDKAIEDISERDKEIIYLRSDGLSYEEISEFLKIKPGTATTAWSRAAKKVRGMVEKMV
jgi:RNA polymerase sigma-70 factor, ECF subfamily